MRISPTLPSRRHSCIKYLREVALVVLVTLVLLKVVELLASSRPSSTAQGRNHTSVKTNNPSGKRSSGEIKKTNGHVIVNLEIEKPKCIHPNLDKLIAHYTKYRGPSTSACPGNANLAFTSGGHFYLTRRAKSAQVTCSVVPVRRKGGDFEVSHGDKKQIYDGQEVPSDVFYAECTNWAGLYQNILMTSISRVSLEGRYKNGYTIEFPREPMNILMVGFDSTSRVGMYGNLPLATKYFEDEMGGVVMKGYNIVGEGTTAALMPILTGKRVDELPDVRRGFNTSVQNLDNFPFLWDKLRSSLGYVTQWAESSPEYGTFTLRMKGFNRQPVDHYMRPYFLEMGKQKIGSKLCLGPRQSHNIMLEWSEELFDAYETEIPKFSFIFHSDYSHDNKYLLNRADGDLVSYFKRMRKKGHLDNTLVVLMTDHGIRYGKERTTLHGKLEERMAFMGFSYPEWFVEKFPRFISNLKSNSEQLTTPFDVHETLMSSIELSATKGLERTYFKRQKSLLFNIPSGRSCDQADVGAHWCACGHEVSINQSSPLSEKSANHLLRAINWATEFKREQCHRLVLKKIVKTTKLQMKTRLLRMPELKERNNITKMIEDTAIIDREFISITIETLPNNAIYESTVLHNINSDTYKVSLATVSRLNAYKDQPRCIASEYPHIRKFCHCKRDANAQHYST